MRISDNLYDVEFLLYLKVLIPAVARITTKTVTTKIIREGGGEWN